MRNKDSSDHIQITNVQPMYLSNYIVLWCSIELTHNRNHSLISVDFYAMDHQEKSWLEQNAAAVGGGILVVLVVIIILLLIVIYRSIFLKKVCVINLLYHCNTLLKD